MKIARHALLFVSLAAALTAAAQTGRSVETEWTRTGTLWSSGTYTYDGAGNIIAIGDVPPGEPNAVSVDKYTYDYAGRLLTATAHARSVRNTQAFKYDRFGNLIEVVTTEGITPPITRSYPASPSTNRLAGYAYDDAGRQLNVPGVSISYRWDALDMMTALEDSGAKSVYIYDADDNRIGIIRGETRRYTPRDLQAKVVREFARESGTAPWRIDRDYVHLGSALLASFRGHSGDGDTPDRHYHLDHLGTPRMITDGAGFKLAINTYFPFGTEVSSSDFGDERLKFTGHEREFNGDVRRDLDYMMARYYAPGRGRFLSTDPGRDWDAEQPQSWNLYAYVRNNPVNRVDPNGRQVRSDSPANHCRGVSGGACGRANEGWQRPPVDSRFHTMMAQWTLSLLVGVADPPGFLFNASVGAATGYTDEVAHQAVTGQVDLPKLYLNTLDQSMNSGIVGGLLPGSPAADAVVVRAGTIAARELGWSLLPTSNFFLSARPAPEGPIYVYSFSITVEPPPVCTMPLFPSTWWPSGGS